MCGRAALSAPPEDLREVFGLDEVPTLAPRFNIAPTQPIPIVRVARTGGRKLELARWGLVPWWAEDPKIGNRFINARVESVATNRAFREAFARHRCLVVVDGFYEWQKRETTDAKGRVKIAKQPFFVRRKDGKPFGMAGLWDTWKSKDGEIVESATVVTRGALGPIAALHDRMPLIVAPDAYDLWLASGKGDPLAAALEQAGGPDALPEIVHAVPPEELEAFPVGTLVNDPKNDAPACRDPWNGPEGEEPDPQGALFR